MDVVLTVDSRDRDYPRGSGSDYTVMLDKGIQNVLSVGVRRFRFPSAPVIGPGRSSIWVSYGHLGASYEEVSIPAGSYIAPTLAAALQAQLNSDMPLMAWTVGLSPSGRLVVSANGDFAVRGGDGEEQSSDDLKRKRMDGYGPTSMGRELGFPPSARLSAAKTLTASHPLDLSGTREYYLTVNDFVATRGLSGHTECTAVVVGDGAAHEVTAPAVKVFSPPLRLLDRIRVRVTDWHGAPADLGLGEHWFELVLRVPAC